MYDVSLKFQESTKFPILSYLNDIYLFFKDSSPLIVKFFNSDIDNIESSHIREHERLLKETDKLIECFSVNFEKLNTFDFWELLEYCEGIKTKLGTLKKISKYLRSSRTDFNFSKGFSYKYKLGYNETLEDISSNVLEDGASDDNWIDIALKNDLRETSYDNEGGNSITLFNQVFNQNFVTSVIDNMIGEKIYGLDLNKNFNFKNNDIDVLSYKDTVYQTVNILSGLKKGDIPEFKSLGVNKFIYIGSNISSLSYNAVIRELTRVFSTDDLFINFKVTEMDLKEDVFMFSFNVETKYNLLIETNNSI